MASVAAVLLSGVVLSGCSAAIDPGAIADAQTAARVKTVLVNDPEVGEFAIEVRVDGGTAILSGRVRSLAQAERAAELARAVPGVTGVRQNLQVGGDPAPVAPAAPPGAADGELLEFDSDPSFLALGANIGWSVPRATALKTRVSVGPLIRLGSPQGLGFALGFDWFQADLASAGEEATITRVKIKPVMAGVGYTLRAERLALTPSIVGGYAFNSLSVTDLGLVGRLPVEVGNSLVWRLGLSAWYDTSARTAINASVGYLMTGLTLTVLEGARLVEQDASGDTAVVHVGIAYKLF